MPTPRADAVAVSGKICARGGRMPASNVSLAAVEMYDPAADAWTIKASLPAPRHGSAAVEWARKV
jgi:hypothetical protein